MDPDRFDTLAKSVATRRAVVAGLAAGLATTGGLTAAKKKRKCRDGTKCRVGKKTQCCTCKQRCTDAGCVDDPRTVRLTFTPFSGDPSFCTVSVEVTGFAAGTFDGSFVSDGGTRDVTVTVDESGTGSGLVDGGSLFTAAFGQARAIVDGLCSDKALTCGS